MGWVDSLSSPSVARSLLPASAPCLGPCCSIAMWTARARTGDFISGEQLSSSGVLGCSKTAQINTKSGWNLGEGTQTALSAFQASVSGIRGRRGQRLQPSSLRHSCPQLPPLHGEAGPCLRQERKPARRWGAGQPGMKTRQTESKQGGPGLRWDWHALSKATMVGF